MDKGKEKKFSNILKKATEDPYALAIDIICGIGILIIICFLSGYCVINF